MSKVDCEVCAGSGIIILPVRRRTAVYARPKPGMESIMDDATRRYPCPECSDKVAEEAVMTIGAEARLVYEARFDEKYKEIARRRIAGLIGDEIYHSGLIHFERGPDDLNTCSRAYRGMIGVVSRGSVIRIERRVKDKLVDVMRLYANNVAKAVRGWRTDALTLRRDEVIDRLHEAEDRTRHEIEAEWRLVE